jgi:hypothetical protein
MAKRGRPKNPRSIRGFARTLGVSQQRVQALKKEGKLQFDEKGGVDQEASLRMHQQRLDAQARSPSKQVKEFYDAKRAKLDYEKAAGAVVDREQVRQEWNRISLAIKNAFLGLGRELAPLLVGRGPQETKAVIDRRVFEILRLLAHKEYGGDK